MLIQKISPVSVFLLVLLMASSSRSSSMLEIEKDGEVHNTHHYNNRPSSLFCPLEERVEISPEVRQILINIPEQAFIPKLNWLPQSYQFSSPELKNLFAPYKPSQMNILEILAVNTLFDKCQDDFEALTNLAKAGHVEAQYKIATSLRFEDDEDSRKLAKELIHRAAAQGHKDSLYELSDAYERIPHYFLLEKNPRLARLLCQEAAALGHEKAELELASAPLDGTFGVPKNYSLAKEKIKILADKGNKLAIERYAYLKDKPQEDYEYLANL